MRCSDVEALWDELRGGLEPHSEHAVAHLRRCKDCQAVYEQYEGVAYCLTCLPLVEPPENLVPRILDHIKALRNHYRSSRSDSIARVASPLGELWVAWRDSRITFVGIDRGQDAEAAVAQIERRLSRPVRMAQAPAWITEAVDDFFATGRVDISRIDISELSAFEQAALLDRTRDRPSPGGAGRRASDGAKPGRTLVSVPSRRRCERRPAQLRLRRRDQGEDPPDGGLREGRRIESGRTRILRKPLKKRFCRLRAEFAPHTTSAVPSEIYE